MSNQTSSEAFAPEPFQAARAIAFWPRHRGFKASLIDAITLRAQGVFGQVIREAKSVVEFERGFARKDVACFHAARCFVEQLNAFVECTAELGFLLLQRCFNQRLCAQ